LVVAEQEAVVLKAVANCDTQESVR
jgi:hypothetical protein